MTKHLFLSYSRRQFYFTETLVCRLQEEDIPLWFDVDRLKPGLTWSEGIRQGLEESQGLIFIVSQAALASPYVEQEWKTTLAAGKPIYLVIFEAVELPPDLADAAAIIVFKGGVSATASRLVNAIRAGQPHRDPLPKPNLLRLPIRLSCDVLLVIMALLGSGLLVMIPVVGAPIDWIYVFPDGRLDSVFPFLTIFIYGLSYGLLGGWFLYQGWLFLRREVSYYQMRFPLPLAPFIAGLAYFFWYGITVTSLGSRVFLSPLAFVSMAVAIGLLNLYAFFRVTRVSEDVFCWLPTGEAPESLRARYQWYYAREWPKSKAQRSATYRLHYAPADRAVAADIRQMMEMYHHSEQETGVAETPDFDLLILSNQTPRDLIERVLHSHGKLISLVASRIEIPEGLSQLTSYQWVDYRKRAEEQLRALATYFSEADPGPLPAGLRALPETLNKPVAPSRITALANIIRIGSAIFITMLVINVILINSFSMFQAANTLLIYVWQFITLIGIVTNVWLIGALMDRRTSLETYTGIMVASYVLGAIALLLNNNSAGQKMLSGISYGLGIYFYYRFFYLPIRVWLPRRAEQTSAATLETRGLLGVSFRNVLVTTLAMALVFIGAGVLFVSPSNNSLPPKASFAGKIAFASERGGAEEDPMQIYLLEESTLNARWLTHGQQEAYAPKWSPDRRKLAFLAGARYGEASLYVMNADGSDRRLIGQGVESFSWSPDGQQIAVTLHDAEEASLYLSAVDNPRPRFLVDVPQVVERKLAWSPDGTKIAFYHEPTIYLVDSDGTNLRPLATVDSAKIGFALDDVPIFAWSPSGDRLAYLDGLNVVVTSIAETSDRQVIASLDSKFKETQTLSWSPDGTQIALVASPPYDPSQLYTVSPDGTNLRNILSADRYGDLVPVWSPDSSQLALAYGHDIYLINADGSGLRPLTNNRGLWSGSEQPAW